MKPLEGIDLQPTSVAEARFAIKELRLRKKEIQAEKARLAAALGDEHERWRQRQAGRVSTAGLGRGWTGGLIRGMVQSKRRDERVEHAEAVNRISDARQARDAEIRIVDAAILEMEREILRLQRDTGRER